MDLPGHNYLQQTIPDAMHTIKDVTEHVFRLVTGRDDNQKVRTAEVALGRSFTSQLEPSSSLSTIGSRGKRSSRATLPSSTFSLTKSQCEVADTRLLGIVLPTHIDYTPKKMFSITSFAHMKSHDWKQFISQGIFKYSLKGLLGNAQQESLFCFIDVVTRVLAEQHDPSTLDKLEEGMNYALAGMERDFPVTLQVLIRAN